MSVKKTISKKLLNGKHFKESFAKKIVFTNETAK